MATTEPATVTTDPTTVTAERAAALRELLPRCPAAVPGSDSWRVASAPTGPNSRTFSRS
jgi:hypothetical protein